MIRSYNIEHVVEQEGRRRGGWRCNLESTRGCFGDFFELQAAIARSVSGCFEVCWSLSNIATVEEEMSRPMCRIMTLVREAVAGPGRICLSSDSGRDSREIRSLMTNRLKGLSLASSGR